MGAESLARLVLPNVLAEEPGLAIAAIAVQAAIAMAIAAWRWRRNYSAR